MDQERKRSWWRNRNLLWAIIVILAVWILILVSIVVDDFGGLQEIGLWEWVGVLIVPEPWLDRMFCGEPGPE